MDWACWLFFQMETESVSNSSLLLNVASAGEYSQE